MLNRIFKGFSVRPVPEFSPALQELGDGLWELERELEFLGGGRLPTRTTIVRLDDGSLVVISAPRTSTRPSTR